MKEKTGRPTSPTEVTEVRNEDLDKRGMHIASHSIKLVHLDQTITAPDKTCGQYGRTNYGRCRYCVRYGIYGADYYGMCQYS